MLFFPRILTALLLALLICKATESSAQHTSENLFYLIDSESSFESFVENIDRISIVAPQVFHVNSDGIVWGQIDARVLRIARENGVEVMPLLTQPGFRQEELHALLGTPEARRRAIDMMLKIAERDGLAGWQFDFENIHVSDRDQFTAFYRETAESLRAAGYRLSVAVVPSFGDIGGATDYHRWLYEYWRSGYDFVALAEIGDFISLMTYSQHTRRSPPGPIAAYDWVEKALAYVLELGVNPEKVSLGLPAYSHHWYAEYSPEIAAEYGRGREGGYSTGRGIGYAEAIGTMERHGGELSWLPRERVHFSMFSNEGIFEYIFVEDARSFEEKLEMLRRHNLRGISVWRLGSEDPAVWEVINRRLITRRSLSE